MQVVLIFSHGPAPEAQPDGHCAPGGFGIASLTLPPDLGTQNPPDCMYEPAH